MEIAANNDSLPVEMIVCSDNVSEVERLHGIVERLEVVKDVTQQQKLDELDYYRRLSAANERKYWTDVGKLQSQLRVSNEMYDVAKREKDSVFMRYVVKEKEILVLNAEKKKLVDALKERDEQIVRLKVNLKEAASFACAIEKKNKEIKECKAMVESLRNEKSRISTDLERWKEKHDRQSEYSYGKESALLREIQALQSELKRSTAENERYNESGDISEGSVLRSQLYLDLKKCSERRLRQTDELKIVIEELKTKLAERTCAVDTVKNENVDLKTLVECCEVKTNELLVFVERLSSHNASLQSERRNLLTALDEAKNDSDATKRKNADLKTTLRVEKDNAADEKDRLERDKKELAGYLAQKMQTIAALKTALEHTRNDLHVSKRRYKTTVANFIKELRKENAEVVTPMEMKMVLDKTVKLQEEKAKLSEKLDRNKHLLCELKEKFSVMRKRDA